MTIKRIPLSDHREQWLAERRAFVNASEVATICGEASYGSLAELYAEKKGLRPPRVDSAMLRRGRWGEAAVFEALAETYPEWDIRRAKIHVRDTERRLACTPDGFATAPTRDGIGVVQAKVISRAIFRDRWLDEPENGLQGSVTSPPAMRLQVLTEMMLNDTKWGVLAVLINGEYDWTFRLIDIERDPVAEDRICYHTAKFFKDHLDPAIMPAFEPQRDEALIRALYRQDNGAEIDLSGDNRALAAVDELIETQAACKRMQKQERALKAELCAKLGNASAGRLADGRRLSWRMQHRKAYSVAATDYRVFRVLSAKDIDT